MEIIIIVSVLSTLGVVAILTSIVVAFIKIKNKVDVNDQKEMVDDLNKSIDHIHRRIDENSRYSDDRFDRLITQIYDTINTNDSMYLREFDDLKRLLDSRCDKLDSKIKATSDILIPKTDKQILHD